MKKILALTWVAVLVSLFVLQSYFQGESTTFFGIADESSQTISFEYPVEIVEIDVVEGNKVEQGGVILKVRRSNLAVEQAVLNEKIQELDSKNQTSIASTRAEIKSLEAKKIAEEADLDLQIKKLQAQYRVNKKLLSDITGSDRRNKSSNSFLEQIDALMRQKTHLGRSIQAQINNLDKQLKGHGRPIYAQINALKEHQVELERQVTELVVKADLTGLVGTILYKAGETVNSFEPILSIHALKPTFVKGYIHENVYNQVKAGQQVWVSPIALNNQGIVYESKVENIGNRIVEYPLRLKKSLLVSAWGREVLIRLDENNTLLLGEKVSISAEPKQPSILDKAITHVNQWLDRSTGMNIKEGYAFNE